MKSLFSAVDWRLGTWLFYTILSIGLVGPATGNPSTPVPPDTLSKPDAVSETGVTETYGKLPLSFEINRGQTHGRVKFLSRSTGYSLLFLTAQEAVLALRRPRAQPGTVRFGRNQGTEPKQPASKTANSTRAAALRIQLVDANPKPRVVGEEELPGKSNYLVGNDPRKWRTNIPHYAC